MADPSHPLDKVHGGNFTEPQIQTVLLTDAVTNACTWAVALHTALGLQAGLDPLDVEAMRAGRSPSDKKLGALSTLARTLIEKRGRLDQDIERFLAAGFGKDLLLEAITIVAASTITNYTGSVTNPPLEAALRAHEWKSQVVASLNPSTVAARPSCRLTASRRSHRVNLAR